MAKKSNAESQLAAGELSACFLTGLDSRVEAWDPSAERLYGWGAEEVVGRDLTELLAGDGASTMEEVRSAAVAQGRWTGEMCLLTNTGEERRVAGRASVVRDRGGEPRGLLMVTRDPEEQQDLADRLIEADSLDAILIVVRGVGHDLNNVTSNLLLWTDFLGNESMSDESRQMLASLERSAEGSIPIIKQLMSLTERSRGQPRIPLNLKHFVNGIRKMAGAELAGKINVVVDYPEPVWVSLGDPREIWHTLVGLVKTASDAGKHSNVNINVENVSATDAVAEPGLERGRHVRLTVVAAGKKPEESGEAALSFRPETLMRAYYPAVEDVEDVEDEKNDDGGGDS